MVERAEVSASSDASRVPLVVAVVQMVSGAEVARNLEQADQLIEQAVARGAQCVLLPENFALLDSQGVVALGVQESAGSGPVLPWLAERSRQHRIWLMAGSLPLAQRPDGRRLQERVRSACLVFDPSGRQVARYDKLHLFDVDVADGVGSYRESDRFEAGDSPVTCALGEGARPWVAGLSICYDLRFPALYQAYAEEGVDLVVVPAAFTHVTGEKHWEVLLRARAIENQVYVLAANQGGLHDNRRRTWGHSMIIDPEGCILDEVREEGPGLAMAVLDPQRLDPIRRAMPVARHRRRSYR